MYKHQKVWKEATGKELPAGWVIHHINGDHNDNCANNLVALPKNIHDSLHWVFKYFRRSEEAPYLFATMLRLLNEEQKNRKIKNVGGRIRHRGYRHKSGKYNWIRTTIDDLEQVISNMKQTDHIFKGIKKQIKGEF